MYEQRPDDLDARVGREQTAYDTGLRRSLYERIIAFNYTGHPYWHHRYRIIADLLREQRPERALELGSTAWRSFFVNPRISIGELHCVNISRRELDKGIEESEKFEINPQFHLMDAHRLHFPDAYFDLVYGIGILHHLEMKTVLAEIERVLQPNGLMIFIEPLNINPVAKIVRYLTPRARTPDEIPFGRRELRLLDERFACTFDFEEFLSTPVGIVTRPFADNLDNRVNRISYRIDEWLKEKVPVLGPYYRRVVVIGRKHNT